MKRKPMKKLLESPVVIPGIYNYCDRWCERCAFTLRCVNFFMSQSFRDGTIEKEMKELYENSEEEDNEFKFPETDDYSKETLDQRRLRQLEAEKEESAVLSRAYIVAFSEWMTENEVFVEKKIKEYEESNSTELRDKLKDDVDVLYWYLFQIHVKIVRALNGIFDELSRKTNGFPKDSDGSAKIALIGIDNSLNALQDLLKHFPEKQGITGMIMILEQLKVMVEKTFPAARSFIRPGFDEILN